MAITDANGFFTVQNVPPGQHRMTVSHRDFQLQATTVSLAQNMAYSLPAPIRIMSVVKAL